MVINKKAFLLDELPKALENLTPDTASNFGLMTPQHMVEHLVWVIKTTAKKHEGERVNPPTKGQLGFQKFIESGCVLQYRPSDKTKADLPPLKYASLEEAIAQIPAAVQRFYDFWDANQAYTPYGSFMGEMSFEDVEL
ncbi:MAG: oxepin-CoA hydrolase/3-oxo-5,6-dehydrosuberyl-CoA semialdehyde dehydrogenase, partial [Saprospiraceae bacterium]